MIFYLLAGRNSFILRLKVFMKKIKSINIQICPTIRDENIFCPVKTISSFCNFTITPFLFCMKILLKTQVEQDYQTVYERFDRDLFLALKPPLLPLELKRFDGSKTGDEVHIRLGKGFLSQDWNAKIVEDKLTEDEAYFIDEGIKLPFFLKDWRHKHRIIRNDTGATIIDDIEYKTPTLLTDYLMYPVMWLQFAARKPVYRKYFRRQTTDDKR